MVRWFASAVLAATALTPLEASATNIRYDCTFQNGTKRDGNWIPEVLVLQHNDKTGEVLVFDPVIKYFIGKPISGTLAEETAARTTFIWEFDARKPGIGADRQAKMRYRFSYFKNGQPARMRATPLGYDNDWSNEGTCKLKKG